MLESYAYICNLCKCNECRFPECSHTTDKRYRMECADETEMRLLSTVNGVNYYMEFVKRPAITKVVLNNA